jgi:16S rRNA (guanine1207-N2)-methyltransferase
MDRDAWVKQLRQDIVFSTSLRDQNLTFHSTWGIFSPRAIDEGTELLLRYIEVNPTDDCFDLGCGYGPIGLTLARLALEGQTLMVDKDFMAVEYANKNAAVNNINNAEAITSNAFQHVPKDRKFDLIVSNVPAKVGKEMLAIMLSDACAYLKPGGRIWVVTITGLRRLFERELKEVFGNYKKIKQGKTYTVAMAIKQ